MCGGAVSARSLSVCLSLDLLLIDSAEFVLGGECEGRGDPAALRQVHPRGGRRVLLRQDLEGLQRHPRCLQVTPPTTLSSVQVDLT